MLNKGKITEPTKFVPLKKAGTGGSYTCDGQKTLPRPSSTACPSNHPYTQVAKGGTVHPGSAGGFVIIAVHDHGILLENNVRFILVKQPHYFDLLRSSQLRRCREKPKRKRNGKRRVQQLCADRAGEVHWIHWLVKKQNPLTHSFLNAAVVPLEEGHAKSEPFVFSS